MAWVSGTIEFEKPSENEYLIEGDIMLTKVDAMALHGVVMDNEGKKPVSGALIMVYARKNDGKEEPLCHTFSSNDGYYLLNLDKNKMVDATAIIVRASANGHTSTIV